MGYKAISKFFGYIAITLTLILCVFTILANMVDSFPPDEHFFINVLAFGLPILLIIDFITFIYWCIFRWKIAIFPLIGILYSIPYLNRTYQFRSEQEIITTSPDDDLLTIATYNMSGDHFNPKKMAFVATLFSELQADILCLEEYSPPANKEDSTCLQISFKEWPYRFAQIQPEYLPIIIFSKYPITNPHKISFLPEKNNFIYCDLMLPQTPIRLFATHIQTTSFNGEKANIEKTMDPSNAASDAAKEQVVNNAIIHFKNNFIYRQQQADSLHTLVKQTKEENIPIIICGDFNSMASEYPYKKLISAGLKDGFVEYGSHIGNTYRYFKQLIRIDYILYTNDLEAVSYRTFNWKMSDHKPIVMQFKQPQKD